MQWMHRSCLLNKQNSPHRKVEASPPAAISPTWLSQTFPRESTCQRFFASGEGFAWKERNRRKYSTMTTGGRDGEGQKSTQLAQIHMYSWILGQEHPTTERDMPGMHSVIVGSPRKELPASATRINSSQQLSCWDAYPQGNLTLGKPEDRVNGPPPNYTTLYNV